MPPYEWPYASLFSIHIIREFKCLLYAWIASVKTEFGIFPETKNMQQIGEYDDMIFEIMKFNWKMRFVCKKWIILFCERIHPGTEVAPNSIYLGRFTNTLYCRLKNVPKKSRSFMITSMPDYHFRGDVFHYALFDAISRCDEYRLKRLLEKSHCYRWSILTKLIEIHEMKVDWDQIYKLLPDRNEDRYHSGKSDCVTCNIIKHSKTEYFSTKINIKCMFCCDRFMTSVFKENRVDLMRRYDDGARIFQFMSVITSEMYDAIEPKFKQLAEPDLIVEMALKNIHIAWKFKQYLYQNWSKYTVWGAINRIANSNAYMSPEELTLLVGSENMKEWCAYVNK